MEFIPTDGRQVYCNAQHRIDSNNDKRKSIDIIEIDFNKGLEGIKLLPKDSRFGVYVAYIYYRKLFNKINKILIMSNNIKN